MLSGKGFCIRIVYLSKYPANLSTNEIVMLTLMRDHNTIAKMSGTSEKNLQLNETLIPLHRLAHSRTGDKGNTANISLIAYKQELFPLLVEQVTEENVRELFRHRNPSSVRRYVLPKLGAMNFVLEDVLDGGVNDSLNLDSHGKTLSFLLLSMKIEVPENLLNLLLPEKGI